MKFNLIFHKRFIFGFYNNRLIAQHPVAVGVSVVIVIWRWFPQTSRMDCAIYSFTRTTDKIDIFKVMFKDNL